ncbi:MAG TPA: 30S ribosomal protein S16 [Candidatus Saccharimonadales bacterium]|nr:30S ribosomal protein S16 [Candidatus Saccharimonadales bacterium]
MSVTIRLARVGKKNAPTYKIVASTTRDKRNGKYLSIIGNYNPALKTNGLNVNKDKLKEWQDKGAMTTKAVVDLLAGNYSYIKYEPNKKVEEAKAQE